LVNWYYTCCCWRSLKLHEIVVVQIILGFCFCSYILLGCSQIWSFYNLIVGSPPNLLKYGRDYPTFACICNRTTYSRSLYAWSHLCCNNPNAIWSKGLHLIHTSSTQFTNKNQELHELCWSLTDQWVWQEVGSNTCKGWVLVLWSIWRVHPNCTSRKPKYVFIFFFVITLWKTMNRRRYMDINPPTNTNDATNYCLIDSHLSRWCWLRNYPLKSIFINWYKNVVVEFSLQSPGDVFSSRKRVVMWDVVYDFCQWRRQGREQDLFLNSESGTGGLA
jgi:hypothetical protein